MMKLGLNTWLWAYIFETRHLVCVDTANELGAEALDFSINDPFSFPTAEVKKKLEGSTMEIIVSTAMPVNCNAISPVKEEREAALTFIKKLIDNGAELGAKVVGGVNYAASGYHTGKPRSRQEIDWDVEYLKEATAYASRYGIDIAMEPVKRFETHFLNRAEQALELIELVGAPNLKVHLDTFHMNIEEADIAAAIELCGDKLAYLHLVDSNRGIPGMGHIPWVGVFKALKKINYSGAACIETFNPETLEETCPLTYLSRRFAESKEEVAECGLRYLRAVRTMVYGI